MDSASPLILIVEDDPNDVLLFQRALKKVRPGTRLIVARDGDEAVRLLAGQGQDSDTREHPNPTHVVLDLKLPKRSGLDVLEWIRCRPGVQHLPVVALTSSKEPQDLERVHRAGVDQHFVKPPNFGDLLKIVREIIVGWRLPP